MVCIMGNRTLLTQFRAGSQGVMFFLVRASAGVWSIIFPAILNSPRFPLPELS